MGFSAAHTLCGAIDYRVPGLRADGFGYLRFHEAHAAASKPSSGNSLRCRSSKSTAECAEIVEVAIDATKEIKEYAVEWALRNVVQTGDFITLLAVVPQTNVISCSWGISGECTIRTRASNQDIEEQIEESCHRMLQQVQKLRDEKKVRIKVKVIEDGVRGIAALHAERMHATWVILDRYLKHEGKYCLEKLHCNVVVVNRLEAKILRLNLNRSLRSGSESAKESSSDSSYSVIQLKKDNIQLKKDNLLPKSFKYFDGQEAPKLSARDKSIHTSSPENRVSFTSTEVDTPINFSSESMTSPCSSKTEVWADPETISTFLGFPLPQAGGSNYCTPPLEYGSTEASSDYESDEESSATKLQLEFSSDLLKKPELSNTANRFSAPGRKQPTALKLIPSVYNQDDFVEDQPLSFLKLDPNIKTGSTSEPITPTGRLLRKPQKFSNHTDSPHSSKSVTPKPVKSTTMSDLFAISTTQGNESPQTVNHHTPVASAMNLLRGFVTRDKEGTASSPPETLANLQQSYPSSLRKSMSLSRHAPPGPPPLCSICQHKAPQFGRPPQRFSYTDLEAATEGFSEQNFLAEGGFGSVHRGMLADGQAIAVKQLKVASSQGDKEFCAEVEVLSCAQHRNVVTLIGYCLQHQRRLLVYEFICNGSLHSHLYGQNRPPLEWQARHKIAIGTARGLRYLHEECRVGCIIHRDMRPNNILLTHDFEPMVGDFGLARWQPDGAMGVETRVIGTFGYLAPEYAQSGQITEKADVYSFGIVLLELVTGRKVVELSRPKGQQCLTEWARPLLDAHLYHELADFRLDNQYNDYEMHCMLQTARLCICPNPDMRPRMSQVMRMLEGDVTIDASGLSSSWSSRHCESFSFCNITSKSTEMPGKLPSHSNSWRLVP